MACMGISKLKYSSILLHFIVYRAYPDSFFSPSLNAKGACRVEGPRNSGQMNALAGSTPKTGVCKISHGKEVENTVQFTYMISVDS